MVSDFDDDRLIFLVSQPRSGSTLLQHILAGHKAIHTTAEPMIMLHPIYALRERGYTAEYDERIAHRALQDFLQALPGGRKDYEVALRKMALYLYQQACQQGGKPYFLDKTPRYYYILPELSRIFPKARFLILVRNPLAVLASILETWVQGAWSRMTYFRHDLLLAPRLLTQSVPSLDERALVVKYESLVTNPETEVAAICHWLDLPFDQEMLEYGGQERVKGRYGDKVGTPKHRRPATTSLDKWLDLAKTPQTRHFAEAYLMALGSDLIRCLGYDAQALEREITTVPCGPGRIRVTWSELFPPEISRANRLRLIYLDARLTGNFHRAIRDLWELIFGRL